MGVKAQKRRWKAGGWTCMALSIVVDIVGIGLACTGVGLAVGIGLLAISTALSVGSTASFAKLNKIQHQTGEISDAKYAAEKKATKNAYILTGAFAVLGLAGSAMKVFAPELKLILKAVSANKHVIRVTAFVGKTTAGATKFAKDVAKGAYDIGQKTGKCLHHVAEESASLCKKSADTLFSGGEFAYNQGLKLTKATKDYAKNSLRKVKKSIGYGTKLNKQSTLAKNPISYTDNSLVKSENISLDSADIMDEFLDDQIKTIDNPIFGRETAENFGDDFFEEAAHFNKPKSGKGGNHTKIQDSIEKLLGKKTVESVKKILVKSNTNTTFSKIQYNTKYMNRLLVNSDRTFDLTCFALEESQYAAQKLAGAAYGIYYYQVVLKKPAYNINHNKSHHIHDSPAKF